MSGVKVFRGSRMKASSQMQGATTLKIIEESRVTKEEVEAKGIKVVDDDLAEQADFLVCLRKGQASRFHDNDEGVCSRCGSAVVFRPGAPKKPARICMECMATVSRERGMKFP